MKGAALAIAASVAVHAALAAVLALYLAIAPEPEVLATLDLSSVELSLAEKDVDSPVLASMPPSSPSSPSPRPELRPPETPRAEVLPAPPVRDAFPADPPESEAVRMETPRERAQALPEAPPQPQEAPVQGRIDAPPRPKTSIRPQYPDGARRRGEQGAVVLEIGVGADGSVGSVEVVTSSGYPELDGAAVRAVRSARFSPARSERESVASTARMTLEFRLRN